MESTTADVCTDNHPIQAIGILCPTDNCRRFILLSKQVYQDRKAATYAHTSLLVLSTLAVVMLSRFTGQIWPMYVFIAAGVMLLYATVFSRGTTLAAASWTLTSTVVVWALWYLLGRSGVSVGDGPAIQLVRLVAPVAGWIAFTGFIYVLSWRITLPAIRQPSAYFLTVGAATFGYWGVWLVWLETRVANPTLFQIAIGVGLALPLTFAALLLWLHRRSDPAGKGWRWSRLSLFLVVLGAYLVLVEPMVRGLSFMLGRFLPLVAGREPLVDVTADWPGGPPWRALVTSFLLMIAVTLVAVGSFLEVTSSEALTGADTGTLGGARQVMERREKEVSESSIEGLGDEAKRKFFETGYTGTYYGKIGLTFVENVVQTARGLINVGVPVAMFSALSAFVVLVLGTFQDHRTLGPFFASISLWGTGLTTWIIVVIMCGFAYEGAQNRSKRATGGVERRGRPFAETGAATLLGGLLYFLVSMVSVALLPLWLYPQDSSVTFEGFVPGEIYFTNLLLSMTALAILGILALAYRSWIRERIRIRRRLVYSLAAVVLVALGVAAVSFAAPPIQVAARYVWTPYDGAVAPALRARIPAGFEPACTLDHLLLTGSRAGLACRTADSTIDVYYHVFSTDDALNHWYDRAVRSRKITAGHGVCGQNATAEGDHPGGRIACYSDRAGTWLIWTDRASRTLSVARSSRLPAAGLHGLWQSGALGGAAG